MANHDLVSYHVWSIERNNISQDINNKDWLRIVGEMSEFFSLDRLLSPVSQLSASNQNV